MKRLYIGELEYSIKYKKEELPQLIGGGMKEIEEENYVWVICSRFYTYNKETKEVDFSSDPYMSK